MKARSKNSINSRRKRYIARTVGAGAAAGVLAWLALVGGVATGSGTAAAASSVADDRPGYAIEDFNYPGADRILADKNIVLKRGDGHITYADCAGGTGFLEVWAREQDKICFSVVGNSGWLTMEIPSVYAIKGNDYTTAVDMTVGAEEKSFGVDKNAWTPVGEGTDPDHEYMLLEIRSSK